MPFTRARAAAQTYDFLGTYVDDLPNVVDLARIKDAGVRIGADPLGGAAVDYWGEIGDRHGLDLTVVNPLVDPTWRFMTLDWDGKIRMDCSSPSAMASLIARKDEYDIATGNDADSDRHGIVTPDGGLMNPNHYPRRRDPVPLRRRAPRLADDGFVGKTLVSSSMIDRVAADLGRRLVEVPVGFKWFVPGLLDGSGPFGGEESAGASFLRRDGSVVDHRQGRHPPGAARLGDPRRDRQEPEPALPRARPRSTATRPTPASTPRRPASRRPSSAALSPDDVDRDRPWPASRSPRKLTEAPGNGAAIGGLKVTTESRGSRPGPSGTEDVYKIYAESFQGPEHLAQVQAEAQDVVSAALGA